jgi:hypothetical protein
MLTDEEVDDGRDFDWNDVEVREVRPVVYLCARYSRHEELNGYAAELRAAGYDVQSEWITGVHADTDSAECARIDWVEVQQADIVISFTEAPGPIQGRGRGGRHVEFGIALGSDKRCIVVGHRENVFHHLPQIEFYESWTTTIGVLAEEVTL